MPMAGFRCSNHGRSDHRKLLPSGSTFTPSRNELVFEIPVALTKRWTRLLSFRPFAATDCLLTSLRQAEPNGSSTAAWMGSVQD